MSLLSNFIQNEFLKSLEAEFLAHEPDLQKAIIDEIQVFANDLAKWVESKLVVHATEKE